MPPSPPSRPDLASTPRPRQGDRIPRPALRRRPRARRPASSPLEEAGEHLPSDTPAPDAAMDAAAVLTAVNQVSSPYRETVVAIDVLGLSYAEGSQALGVP